MTRERDPFDRLSEFVDPEPDPVVMKATIAQSREAFIRQRVEQTGRAGSPVGRWLRQSRGWFVPAGAGAFALVLAVAIGLGVMRPVHEGTAGRDMMADRPQVDAPAEPTTELSRAPSPQSSTGTRLGAQPAPADQPTNAAPGPVSIVEGDGVRVETRASGSELQFLLPDISGEQVIDSQLLFSGEELTVIGAFRLPEADMIAVEFETAESRFWRIYQPADGVYARDQELSALVSGAVDRTDIETRLRLHGAFN